MGQVSDKALELTGYHKNPAVRLVVGDRLPKKGVQGDEDLRLVKDRPLQTLY